VLQLVRTSVIAIAVILIIIAIIVGLMFYRLTYEEKVTQTTGDIDAIVRSLVGNIPKNIEVSSNAFTQGSTIPVMYTCDGEDVTPPLRWSSVEGAKYYAVIVVDPDAPKGIFIHWIIYNIPNSITSLKANIPKEQVVHGLGFQSLNDFGKVGYGGPCPPHGSKHRYIFIVVALKDEVTVGPGSSPLETLKNIRELAISYGFIYAYYSR